MKILILIASLLGTLSVSAREVDGINSKEAEAVLEKLGTGMVYENGKAVIRKPRTCALFRNDFATESFERDVLVIGYAGKPIPSNNFGINPQGRYIGRETFWEAGVLYDVTTSETRTEIEGGVRYEVCQGKPNGAFASSCTKDNFVSRDAIEITKSGVVMTSEGVDEKGKKWSYKSTCEFNK